MKSTVTRYTVMAFMAVALMALAGAVSMAEDNAPDPLVEKGRMHFINPKFAGGTSGRSCNDCHLEGRNLQGVAKKESFNVGGKEGTLADMVNYCIVNALRGKAIDKDSTEMKEMLKYLESLSLEPIGIRG